MTFSFFLKRTITTNTIQNGFIPLIKKSGITSATAVGEVKRLLKLKKVGHSGTLDKLASGVLVLAAGSATKLIPYLWKYKEYKSIMKLGIGSDTYDRDGQCNDMSPVGFIEEPIFYKVISSFIGDDIDQIPPVYSALKKDGKRLSDRIRSGENIEEQSLKPRKISIYDLNCEDFIQENYPEVTFTVKCSGGTYIRSLVRDIGIKLSEYYNKSVPTMMWELLRVNSNGFNINESFTLEEIQEKVKNNDYSFWIKPDEAFERYLSVIYPLEKIKKSDRGRKSISVFSDLIKRNVNQVVTLRDNNYKIWSICYVKSENKVDVVWENSK